MVANAQAKEVVQMGDFSKMVTAAGVAHRLTDNPEGAIRQALKAIESSTFKAMQELQGNLSVSRIIADIDQNKSLVRGAQGLLAELHRSGIFDHAQKHTQQLAPVIAAMESYNARFSLPEIKVAERLMDQLTPRIDPRILDSFTFKAGEIQRAVESMHTPWLDAENSLRSATSFVELQGIGSMLSRLPSFDDTITTTLRSYLGDWRDTITWPEPVLTDLSVREKFYVGLGFDTSLTDLPEPAFQESTEIAGLRQEPPVLVDAYGEPFPRADDSEGEKALARTNKAHDWLMRLETSVRRFIDARMTAEFGEDWPKHRLPNNLYDKWISKREAAERAGRATLPLVAYADFTDYVSVICKADNWREVFGRHFDRPESVRESFQRLHPIRLDAMHARPIGQDDELLLYVEVKRLVRVVLM
jgi:hypothetical protein